MTEISYPWPARQLFPNWRSRSHWPKTNAVKKARSAAGWLTKAARVRVDPGLVPMTFTFYPPDARKRDRDGMIAATKSMQDGIADALGVDDNCFRIEYRFCDPVPNGKIVVEIVG